MEKTRLLLLLVLIGVVAAAPVQNTLDGPFKPVTVSFDTTLPPGSDDLPPSDPRLAPQDNPAMPEQISLALSPPDGMYVTWITEKAQLVAGPVKPLIIDPKKPPLVKFRQQGLNYSVPYVSGYDEVYSQEYPYDGLFNYTSGIIHHVRLQGLLPSTTYYYSCGDGSIWSPEMNFTTLPVTNATNYPARIAILGDLGLTFNSTSTVDHMMSNNPDLFLMIGDLSYADNYVTNGTGASCYACAFPDAPTKETHQPRWDYWGRFMQKLVSRVPMMVSEGNHEREPQINGQTFVAYNARYSVPYKESGSPSKLFYSFNSGGIHFIMLGAYTDFDKSSQQYAWLAKDLAAVDRKVTPWVIATTHTPWYSSYKAHYREGECMRQAMEDLLYKYNVDMVFAGHVHAYERMNRVYNYSLDKCGPVHMTIGDGGNIERLKRDYADSPGMCPNPQNVKSFSGKNCLFNFSEADNKFCWSKQPIWSALRDPSFGHGILEVKNQTHALWTWYRNQDGLSASGAQGDQVYIVRQPDICLKPSSPSSSPSPSPSLSPSSSPSPSPSPSLSSSPLPSPPSHNSATCISVLLMSVICLTIHLI